MTAPVVGDGVLVVGAGPTGLVAALLLASRGIACTVVERHHDVVATPRAVHLDGASVRILQQIGLAEDFAAISRPASGLRLLDAALAPFAEFRHDHARGEHGHPDSNLFDQPDLERLLRAEVARRCLVTLRGGVELRYLEQDAGSVVVTLRDTADGSTERVPARAVLGCDGSASSTRQTIGARLRDLGFSQRWFVLDVRCPHPLPTWGGVDQLCGAQRAATFLPLPGQRYRWEFRMRPAETAEELSRPARIAELTAPWRAGVPAAELEVLRAAAYTFRAAVADRWRDRRVLLLGDAAHLTPPFIGQGLGLGLGDAHNLAWKLAAVLGTLPSPDSLLDSYQGERGPHAAAVVRGALRVGRAMTGGNDLAAALRQRATGLVLRSPAVRARARRGIVTRYRATVALDRRRHRRDLVGTCCPQPLVRVDGATVPLDDVLGDGYALLVAGPLPVADQLPAALRTRARQLGARVLRIGSDADVATGTAPGEVVATDDGELAAWLRGGRAAAALLRPDRVVGSTAPLR